MIEYIVQGFYDSEHGWEDLTAHDSKSEADTDYHAYRMNEPQYAHRVFASLVETDEEVGTEDRDYWSDKYDDVDVDVEDFDELEMDLGDDQDVD